MKLIMGSAVLNANVKAASAAFAENGTLSTFHTPLAVPLPVSVRPAWAPRTVDDVVLPYLRLSPLREIGRLTLRTLKLGSASGRFSIDAVSGVIDQIVARRINHLPDDVDSVYMYEDGAAQSFRAARDLGYRRIYDLPIGYAASAQRVYKEEALAKPEWVATMPGLSDSPSKLEQKALELQFATDVVVASSFTASTVRSHLNSKQRLHIVPYGAPRPTSDVPDRHNAQLRVAFVGSLTQRKGLSYLIDALASFGSAVQPVVIGRKISEVRSLNNFLRTAEWTPAATHARVLEILATCDVLVLPSLFEGFGLVLTEALSQGVPIIASSNTAAPDLLVGNPDAGWVVPIRSADAIREALDALLGQERRAIAANAALELARALTWSDYKRNLTTALDGAQP